MIKNSTGLRNAMLGTTGAKAALTGAVLNIYAGTEPATADAALGGATLLVSISKGGDGSALGFENPADGILVKSVSEVWVGTVLANGTPTFYRLQMPADTDTASTTAVRIQGSVGNAGDLKLGATVLASGNPQSIDYYQLELPGSLG